MTLIIEDGTNVANANSYISCVNARAYAISRGITLPATDPELEILLIKSMDYLESLREKYQGVKTYSTQCLQWPRYGVYIDGNAASSILIPNLLIKAQAQLSMEVFAGIDLQPTSVGYGIKKEKVDAIETEYFNSVGSPVPNLRLVNSLLNPLFRYYRILSNVRV